MSGEPQTPPAPGTPPVATLTDSHRSRLPLIVTAIMVVAGVAVTSTYALATFILDAVAAAAVLAPAALAGLWLVPLFRLGSMPLRWHLLLGATFGLGLLAATTLVLGWLGLLARPLWLSVLVVMGVAGIVRLQRLWAAHSRRAGPHVPPLQWLWMLVAPFLILAALAAAHAPGFLWSEEGWGYDVLEYHLALPKEYRQQGHIAYTPHNVYGNFPANVEMLYLIGMIVLDEDMEAGTTAHMIHLWLGVLTAFAAYVGGREWSRPAGVLAGVLVGTCGWCVYLSGLAFVEGGLLFFGMTAAAAVSLALRCGSHDVTAEPCTHRPPLVRWYVVAAATCGFACGCKYTALPMIGLPVLATALLARASWSRRCAAIAAGAGVMIATFSPWLIKNVATTGNPVFPLANRWFQATPPGWGMAESAHWERCHGVAANVEASSTVLPPRVTRLWTHVLNDRYRRFGPLILAMAVVGCCARRPDRATLAILLVLVLQVAVWLLATHLYARFAVVLMIPLALLGCRAAVLATSPARAWVLVVAVALGAAINFQAMLTLYRAEAITGATAPASYIYQGRVPGYEYLGFVNRALPGDVRLLVIGDAKAFYYDRPISYRVVFNRQPFVEAIREDPRPEALSLWLHQRSFTHVLVHYAEIDRLRRSAYGFPQEIDHGLFVRLERAGVLARLRMNETPVGQSAVVLYQVKR